MKAVIKNIAISLLVLAALSSCTEKHELFNLQESQLNFEYPGNSEEKKDSIVRYTFVYNKSDIKQDTIWVDMGTMGFLFDHERKFSLQQVDVTMNDTYGGLEEGEQLQNAEAGKHYMAFDNAAMEKYLVVKGGENKVRFPVIVYRDESLLEGKFYLKFQLKPNENFTGSFETNRYYVIELTELFVKPKDWNTYCSYYFSGEYGAEKLKFMVNSASWTINEEWFTKNFSDPNRIDMGYAGFLSGYFTDRLVKLNKERAKEGKEPLKEADGTIVAFTNFGQPQPYI